MDHPKPKEDSPEKTKFANSLVAMYGSGSDTSEDDDSQPNDAKPSESSVPSDVSKDHEIKESQDKSKASNDLVINLNEVLSTSSEANKSEREEKIDIASKDTSLLTTQEAPPKEGTSKIDIIDNSESGVEERLFQDVRSSTKISAPVEEVKSTDCPAINNSEDKSIEGYIAGNSVTETIPPVDSTSLKSNEDDLDNHCENSSVGETESARAKDVQPSNNEKDDVGQSVQDIVQEIDSILAQGTSGTREIQKSKLGEDIETAVASINLEEKMDVDSTSAIPVVTSEVSTKGETAVDPAKSEAQSEKMSVDELPAEDQTEKMEVAKQSVKEDVGAPKIESFTPAEEENMDDQEGKVVEIPDVSQEQNSNFVKNKIPDVAEDKMLDVVEDKTLDVEEKVPDVVDEKIPDVVEEKIPDVAEDKIMDVGEDKIMDVGEDKIMDVAEEKIPDVAEDKIMDVAGDKISDVAEDKISDVAENEIPDVAEDEIPDVAEDEIPDVAKDEIPETAPVVESTKARDAEKMDTHETGTNIEEITQTSSRTEEKVPEDRQETVVVSKSSEEDTEETYHAKEEKKSESIIPITAELEVKKLSSEEKVIEEEISVETISNSSKVDTEEDEAVCRKTVVVEKEMDIPKIAEECEKEITGIVSVAETAELRGTKLESTNTPEEETIQRASGDEEVRESMDKEEVLSAVEEENAKVAEAPEEASDSSFATCEELDKSDEIARGEDDVKFADATDELTTEEKAISLGTTLHKDTLGSEASELAANVSEVPKESQHFKEQASAPNSSAPSAVLSGGIKDSSEELPDEVCESKLSPIPEESIPAEQTQMECEEQKIEVGEKMEVDEVDRVPPSEVDVAPTTIKAFSETKATDCVIEESTVPAQTGEKYDEESAEPVKDSKDVEVSKREETKASPAEKLPDPTAEDVCKEAAAPDENITKEDVSTEGKAAPSGKKKEPTVRRLRQVRHPSAKAAEAAADAAFVAAVTPTRTNLKEAKIACAIANVTETSEVIHKELPTPSRLRKNRSSSTEPQPAHEIEPTEQAGDKPVSIKLKIVKDAVEIVSSEKPDSSGPTADAKRQKKDLSDLPAVKEAHYMKKLEVQIPPSDVNIYETTMSPGGTLRKHKRHKEGPASPSVTLSPITLKIAKDKSSENLCCIVPEEVRTASPVDSEGREKITLKISKDDKLVRSSVSPLVSPAERSEEARSEKAALKLAKEEAAALARNREGVASPRSDDGESRLERITLKLSAGEKNSWSIKSADSDSALSPSSTDSGSTKMKPKISVVRMEDLLEGEGSKGSGSKRQVQASGGEGFVLQIAERPVKRPLEEVEEVPTKVMKVEVTKPPSVESDDVEILDDKPEVPEEPVDQKPPIEEIILEDSSSMPAAPAIVEKPPVQQQLTPMDVDDDVVILSANIVKKARGRPRKVRPLPDAPGKGATGVRAAAGAGTAAAAAPAAAVPVTEAKPQAEESQDHRPKRVCKGRERLPPKPTKPRGRYAHLLKLRQAEEAAAAAAAAAAGGDVPTSTDVSLTLVPSTTATPTTVSVTTPKPALTTVKTPKESPTKTPKESPARTPKESPVKSSKESPAKAQKESPVKTPKEQPAKTPRASGPKAPHPKTKIIRPEAPQVFEEETRMSADISSCPTPTPTQSESPGAASSAQAAPAQQAAAQPEGRPGISFNSPLAAIDSTGILPRLVITPCTLPRPQTPALSTTGDESQSNSATELTRASGNKKGRMEVVDPDAKVEFTVDMIAEYMWPMDKPGVRGEIYMIQEQISLYLGVKSFKRKYPNLTRRPVEHEERQYLLDRKLVSEKLCDLGLTAVVNHEVLDVMVVDFPEKYEEYRKYSSEKAQRQLSSKQKAISTGRLEDSTSVAQRDAASFNSMLNRERREQRKCFFDLQAFSIQYPENRRKKMIPANLPKVGHYPVALVPGQYTDYFKKYTAAELRYFPLNTVLYGPLMPGEIRNLHMIGGSEGSQTDSSDSSSSDSDSSNSGSSGSSDSDSSSDDSDDEMSTQVEKTESHDSIPDKDVSPCKVCSGDRQKNKLGVPEPLIVCAVCSSSGHPTCLDLTVDMVPHIRKYNWQCTDCKTCAQCKDPADEDKMLFCDMCDRGYHIYCVGLRKVPEGRWHCTECALCSSCGSRDPGGVPDQQKTEPVAPNNTPNKSDLPQWQHEFKKGDKGSRVYVRTLCVPCSRLWKKGRYCRLCWKCYGNKPEEEGLINCSACDRWMHSDCCRSAGSVIDDKTSNFLCELCQQKGVRSPIKNFKTPVR